jgi:hypothetical protein
MPPGKRVYRSEEDMLNTQTQQGVIAAMSQSLSYGMMPVAHDPYIDYAALQKTGESRLLAVATMMALLRRCSRRVANERPGQSTAVECGQRKRSALADAQRRWSGHLSSLPDAQ